MARIELDGEPANLNDRSTLKRLSKAAAQGVGGRVVVESETVRVAENELVKGKH